MQDVEEGNARMLKKSARGSQDEWQSARKIGTAAVNSVKLGALRFKERASLWIVYCELGQEEVVFGDDDNQSTCLGAVYARRGAYRSALGQSKIAPVTSWSLSLL